MASCGCVPGCIACRDPLTRRYRSLEEIKREFFPRLHEEEKAARAARPLPREVEEIQRAR